MERASRSGPLHSLERWLAVLEAYALDSGPLFLVFFWMLSTVREKSVPRHLRESARICVAWRRLQRSPNRTFRTSRLSTTPVFRGWAKSALDDAQLPMGELSRDADVSRN